MRWLARLKKRYRWRYVGTVHGRTVIFDDGKPTGAEFNGYWVLTERGDGKRSVKKTGDAGTSAFAEYQRAAVEAWLAGGSLISLAPDHAPYLKPKKAKASQSGNVVTFPGGKGAA